MVGGKRSPIRLLADPGRVGGRAVKTKDHPNGRRPACVVSLREKKGEREVFQIIEARYITSAFGTTPFLIAWTMVLSDADRG